MAIHLAPECRIGLGRGVGLFQFEDQRHQGFGDEPPAIDTEMPALVRPGPERVRLHDCHAVLASFAATALSAMRAALMKARIFSASFSPGARSTPDDTS